MCIYMYIYIHRYIYIHIYMESNAIEKRGTIVAETFYIAPGIAGYY